MNHAKRYFCDMKNIRYRIHAKIGELAQGYLSKQEPFLVSNLSSASLFSETILHHEYCNELVLNDKASQAYHLFFNKLSEVSKDSAILSTEGKYLRIYQKSNIPKGKGLSSSSADILGVLCCLNQYYSYPFDTNALYRIAANIEPTDPLLSSGITIFKQLKGEVLSNLNDFPFVIMYFDCFPGLSIDTVKATQSRIIDDAYITSSTRILMDLQLAVYDRDYSSFFKSITDSAKLNQKLLPKTGFEEIVSYAQTFDAGVFVAHTGTIMGLVVKPEDWHKSAYIQRLVFKRWGTDLVVEKGLL
jgi:uncharacterized protein involved in propanediol utilization